MSRTTLQDKFVAALNARGHNTVKQLSGCYVLQRNDTTFYYVGSSGSLRVGKTRNGSLAVRQEFKDKLIGEYDALPRS